MKVRELIKKLEDLGSEAQELDVFTEDIDYGLDEPEPIVKTLKYDDRVWDIQAGTKVVIL